MGWMVAMRLAQHEAAVQQRLTDLGVKVTLLPQHYCLDRCHGQPGVWLLAAASLLLCCASVHMPWHGEVICAKL